jgi:hypothetical protein
MLRQLVQFFDPTAMPTPEEQHAAVAAFSAKLPLRPDAEHVRCSLAAAFAYHVDEIWPAGEPAATPAWIATHTDEILATIERLYAMATDDQPGADEFLDRLSWLPPLLVEIDRSTALDG